MHGYVESRRRNSIVTQVLPLVMVAASVMSTWWVPVDGEMGDAQRIVYVHVSMAWVSLSAFIVVALTGAAYLWTRKLRWDDWSHAASELGWLSCGLTLVSGSFWAHEAWGTWWTWDPRLTTAFLLWMIYSALLTLRSGVSDVQRAANSCAVLALLGLIDVPFVVMATRWFRGIHPVAPEMAPAMRLTLFVSVGAYSAFFLVLLLGRSAQIGLSREIARQVARQSEAVHHRRTIPSKRASL